MRRLSESTDLTSNCVLLLLNEKDLPEQPKHHILISGFGKAILIYVGHMTRLCSKAAKRHLKQQRGGKQQPRKVLEPKWLRMKLGMWCMRMVDRLSSLSSPARAMLSSPAMAKQLNRAKVKLNRAKAKTIRGSPKLTMARAELITTSAK